MVPNAERIINTIPPAKKYNPTTNIKYLFKSSFIVNPLSAKSAQRYGFSMKLGIFEGMLFQKKQILSVFEHPFVIAFLGIL